MDLVPDEERWRLTDRPLADRSRRRFTLRDGMILVVAAAAAFVMLRPFWDAGLARFPLWGQAVGFGLAALIAATPCLLAIRLIRPRPTFGQLCRRPGFVATLVGSAILAPVPPVLLAIVPVGARDVRTFVQGSPEQVADSLWWAGVVFDFGLAIGPAVIVSWSVLALTGRRSSGRDWLDAAGQAVGVAWIVAFAIYAAARLYAT